MKSAIVHYQEIALKGKNRPWFVAKLVHNIREALSDLGVRQVRALMGRIEVVLGPASDWPTVHARLSRVFGAANFARAGRVPLDIDGIAQQILERSRSIGSAVVPRVRAARRQAVSDDLSAARARDWRPHQGSARVACRSREPGADHSRGDADRRGVLLVRQGARRGWVAGGRERARRLFAVWRHRFASRRMADDAAGLPGHLRSLPQLSDPVARIAGEGA